MDRGRRVVVARVVASLAALFWAVLWFGIIDLLVVVEQDAEFDQDYLFESGWGLLFLVLVAAPLVVLAVRPSEPVALAQLGVVAVAILVGALWRGAWPQVWNALGVAGTGLVVGWLGRARPPAWRRPDVPLAVLAVVGLPAAVLYAAPLIGNTTVTEDITNGVSHWPMQASLALAVVGLVALAAVTRGRLPAWTVAVTVAWLGVESLVYPDLHASLGSTGGVLAVGWVVLVVGATEWARRRTTPVSRRSPAAPRA